ncbi:MAG TPA: hypothetical protein VFF79_17290 [Conexibacter sp.]|nr:hypothetical protein [Conexibacter sp.]
MAYEAILLPGGVMPADLAHGALLEALGDEALGDDVTAIAKDLEVYAGPEPPPGYTLDDEVAGVSRTARDAGFDRFALGGRSNPDHYRRMAERARAIFPNFTLDVFDERHHFDPPHRIEPERTARALQAHWTRADN